MILYWLNGWARRRYNNFREEGIFAGTFRKNASLKSSFNSYHIKELRDK